MSGMSGDIYTKKQKWKLILIIAAVLIGIFSLLFTNKLVRKLATEERKSVELWAKATRQISNMNINQDFSFISEVIINNNTIPVIQADENNNILFTRNLDSLRSIIDTARISKKDYERNLEYLNSQMEKMKSENEPIEIQLMNNHKNYIYYKDSVLLNQLFYYPFFQLGVIFLFILVSYFAFSSSRKSEQNQVWVGMSKETAHQLGTPISSLLAWVEYLKLKDADNEFISEIEKDVQRLETITERFSKIGSAPSLTRTNLVNVIYESVSYIRKRSSDKVIFNIGFAENQVVLAPINSALFEWVIENLCKNSLDAMNGNGSINISIQDNNQVIYLDIADSGKGIHKSKFKTVFQPGYTTKTRGWGLGLSLSKRIIEDYHDGKIFIKSSDPETGTTFRIALRK